MDTEYKRAANITVIVAGILIFLWLFFKYLLGIALPFLLAALIAVIISPVAAWVSKKTHASQKFVSAFLVLLFFGMIATLLSLAISRLVSEVGNLIDRVEVGETYMDGDEKKQDIRILFNFIGEVDWDAA